MAKFDPNKIPILDKSSKTVPKFNPDDIPFSRDAGQESKRRLLQGMQQRMLSTEDFGRGARAGFQNLGAYATSSLPEGMQIPRYDPQPTSSYGSAPITAGKIASSFFPAIGTEKAVAAGLGAIEQIPSWLSRIAGGSAGGAASAPSIDAKPSTGAALGLAGAAIPEAGLGIIGRYLGKNVTPEQFEAARQTIPGNVKAPIGELADSPSAKKLYGISRGIAFSGADKPYKQMYDYLNKGAKELVSDAPDVSNASQFVYDDMKSSYEAAKENTNKAYSELASYADKNDVPFDRESFDKSIDESVDELNKKIKNKTTAALYGDALSALKDFKGTKIDTFSDATSIRPALNDLIKKSAKEDDRVALRHLQKMKNGLDSSISKSSTADKNLMHLHSTANSARINQGTYEKLNKKDLSPFYKIYVKDGSPDNFIGSHIKSSPKGDDYSGLLGELTKKLSPDARNVMAKAYLNPRDDSSLARQITKLNKLSPTQKQLMFGDKADLANSLSKTSSLYPSAKGADFTPLTGFTGAKTLQMLGEGAGLGAGMSMANPQLLAATGILPALGQAAQRGLRSEGLKDAYMRYLKGLGPKSSPLGKAARTGAIYATGENDNG